MISLTWNICNRQVQRKSRLEIIRGWEKEEWGVITSNGYRVSIWDYEILEIDNGAGCKTLWV